MCLWWFLVHLAIAEGQEPKSLHQIPQAEEQSAPYRLSVDADLVLLDVVVTDEKMLPVKGLKRGDFEVFENAHPRPIVSFEVSVTPESPPVQPINSTEELDQKEPTEPVSIVVLDEITTSFEDKYFARHSLERYLSKQGDRLDQPVMLLARTVDRLMVLHDYTTSKADILNALDRHNPGMDWNESAPERKSEQFAAALASLMEIAKATEGHPGHKNLIWIGRGFPNLYWDEAPPQQGASIRRVIATCINLMRDARITLNTIDPAGVITAPPSEMTDGGPIPAQDPFGGDVDFEKIAYVTGGMSLHGRNDVDRLVEKSSMEGKMFYTIGIRPRPNDTGSTEFRQIKVEVNDPKLKVLSRHGYYGDPKLENTSLQDASGDMGADARFDLSAASNSLLVFDGIPLTVERRQQESTNSFMIRMPLRSLGAIQNSSSTKAKVVVVGLGYDRRGQLIERTAKSCSVSTRSPIGCLQSDGSVQIAIDLKTQIPVARLRFIARSTANGRIGTENLFLMNRESLQDPATGIAPQK